MKNHTRSALTKRVLVCIAAFAAVAQMPAQTTPPKTSDDDKKASTEEVVKLSPFTVSDKADNGYHSEDTLIGSRTAKSLLATSDAISIINKQVITDLNAVDVHQLIQVGVAGVTQNQTINDDFNIRGFRSLYSLRDGITKVAYKRNPLFDVERVEVIKGPAAMLLGNNSFLGGTVNFVTRGPSHIEGGDAQVTVGKHDYVRLAANNTGPLVDSSDLKVDYRVTVGLTSGDKDKEIEQEDNKFIGGALGFHFGPNTSFNFRAYYYKDDGYFYWDDVLDYNSTVGGTLANPTWAKLNQYSTKSFSPGQGKNAFWKNQDIFINGEFLTRLSENGNLRLDYVFSKDIDRRRHVRGITMSSDNVTLQRQDIPVAIDAYTHDFQADYLHHLELPAGIKLDSTLGADAIISYTATRQSVNVMPNLNIAAPDWSIDDAYFAAAHPGAGIAITSTTPGGTANMSRAESNSYFFQENLSFWDERISLIGGVRWFEPDGYGTNYLTNVTTPRSTKTFKTHKYGAIIRPIPSISFYWTDVQTIFPQTGFADLHTANDNLDPLQDQEGKMKEAGFKVERKFNDKISIYGSVAWYDMAQTHVVINSLLPDGTSGRIQSAQDSAKGLEYELGGGYKLYSGEFNWIATFADGQSHTAANPNIGAQDFVPQKYSFMGRYGWTSGPLKGLTLGGTYFDQSRKRESTFWIDFPATYNAFARYVFNKHWSAQLNLNNITDKRYIVAIAATGLVQTEPGFDGKFSATYKW